MPGTIESVRWSYTITGGPDHIGAPNRRARALCFAGLSVHLLGPVLCVWRAGPVVVPLETKRRSCAFQHRKLRRNESWRLVVWSIAARQIRALAASPVNPSLKARGGYDHRAASFHRLAPPAQGRVRPHSLILVGSRCCFRADKRFNGADEHDLEIIYGRAALPILTHR